MAKSIMNTLNEEFQTLPKLNINKHPSKKEIEEIEKQWNNSMMSPQEKEELKNQIRNHQVLASVDDNGNIELLS